MWKERIILIVFYPKELNNDKKTVYTFDRYLAHHPGNITGGNTSKNKMVYIAPLEGTSFFTRSMIPLRDPVTL
jgi:hypothetical protein